MSKPIMLSENSRKSATKLLLVNWSRFSNVPIALEGSTLFTGVNGSGKSTILDAMTYMLTGNTQFNKAALDRDRNVVSYVRGDTKSEGKNRFIREGEVTSYIAMEFWAPLENQYLVVGVCIEYVNETSNTKKWFVFKDTRIDDCRFYTVKEKEVTVYPRHELTVKGKKVPAGEFMNRDKGTEQVLDKKEKEKAILEEYQVFSNPSYIFFKGNVDIHYVDGNSISVTPDNPIAILSEAIARIEMIKVNSNRIVTVENLTSYNRINDNKSTFIYLSGYHNTAKQRFLKKIAENNSGVSWFHFGDIDPDGYYILKNLVEKTGIAFVPLYMDVQQLINCKQYCKPLEKNDMVKANSLLKFHFYDEVMEFMLANNCKLEQEIISWLYERD